MNLQSGYKTTEIPSALTSNSSAICSNVTHWALSSTVYGSHTDGEHGTKVQVIQLVDTPLCIVLNKNVLCTAILRCIVHLFVEGEGRKMEEKEGGKEGGREGGREGEKRREVGEREEGEKRREGGRYAAVLNKDVLEL